MAKALILSRILTNWPKSVDDFIIGSKLEINESLRSAYSEPDLADNDSIYQPPRRNSPFGLPETQDVLFLTDELENDKSKNHQKNKVQWNCLGIIGCE